MRHTGVKHQGTPLWTLDGRVLLIFDESCEIVRVKVQVCGGWMELELSDSHRKVGEFKFDRFVIFRIVRLEILQLEFRLEMYGGGRFQFDRFL